MALPDTVRDAIAAALNIRPEDLPADASVDSVPEWDSIANLAVITEMEARFGVSVSLEDSVSLRSVDVWRAYLRAHGRS